MNIFIAGGSGAIGVPLVKALVAAGHEVTAQTRSPGKMATIRALGARPAVADALDPEGLRRAVIEARPSHVIHQLTALPKEGARRASQLRPTNRLRVEGTRNLLAAAVEAGAQRIVVGSFALFRAPMPGRVPRDVIEGREAILSMESQVLDADRRGAIEGVVLRYGLFYGRGNPVTDQMVALVRRRRMPVVRGDRGLLPFIHVDDAVSATIAALERAPAGSTYDIVDDEAASMSEMVAGIAAASGAPQPFAVPHWLPRLLSPFMARFMSLRLPLSNAKAREELGWRPQFPSWRDGIAQVVQQQRAA